MRTYEIHDQTNQHILNRIKNYLRILQRYRQSLLECIWPISIYIYIYIYIYVCVYVYIGLCLLSFVVTLHGAGRAAAPAARGCPRPRDTIVALNADLVAICGATGLWASLGSWYNSRPKRRSCRYLRCDGPVGLPRCDGPLGVSWVSPVCLPGVSWPSPWCPLGDTRCLLGASWLSPGVSRVPPRGYAASMSNTCKNAWWINTTFKNTMLFNRFSLKQPFCSRVMTHIQNSAQNTQFFHWNVRLAGLLSQNNQFLQRLLHVKTPLFYRCFLAC